MISIYSGIPILHHNGAVCCLSKENFKFLSNILSGKSESFGLRT